LRPVVNPLGIVSAPGELAASLRTLPELLDALRQVGDDTRRMADNTAELPDVRAQLERVAEMTSVLPQMDRRMATIEEAMPVLVEVQRHLAKLPETIEGLNRGIAELVGLMDGLQASLGHLHESLEPLGRLADRIPGGNRR
jgi:chemotaxis regulatin CheY-phosphate phosphatase CheZ